MDNIQQIKKKSIAGALSYFARTIFLQVIGLVSILVLSAFFSAEDFGIYGFIIQIIGILVFFSDIGLAASLIQKPEKPTDKEFALVFTVQQALSWLIVIVAIFLIGSGFVAKTTGEVGNWVLLALALSFPLATIKTIPSVKLERELLFNKLVIPQIFEQITFHGILIYLAWQGFGVIAYAYAVIFRSLVGVVVMLYLAPWRPQLYFEIKMAKSLLSYGALFQTNDLLARIKDQLFYVVLAMYLPLQSYGYVQWAKTWSMYPYNLTVQNLMAITFPVFSRLQGRPDLLKKAIEISIFCITLFIFPLLIGMSVFVHPFVDLTPVYEKWKPALFSLTLFTLSIGWSAVSTVLTNTLNAIGHISKTLKLMLIWTSLTWMLTPLAVWRFGYDGVAISALVISFSSVLSIWYTKKVINFSFLDQVWRQILASVAMAVVGVLGLQVWGQSYLHLLFGMMMTVSLYFMMIYAVGKDKLFLVWNMILSRK